MAESSTHIEFVYTCKDYIVKNVIPSGDDAFVCVDCPETTQKPPAVVGGVRPDLYYRRSGLLVIGEAKTIGDIDNIHSRKQYECYFEECKLFEGDSYIVVCSSWSVAPSLWTILKRMKLQNNYAAHIIVLFENGKYREL